MRLMTLLARLALCVAACGLPACGGGDGRHPATDTDADADTDTDTDIDTDTDTDSDTESGSDTDTEPPLCDETDGDQFIWVRVVGGAGDDGLGGLASAADGSVIATGAFASSPAVFGDGVPGLDELYAEDGGVFLVKYDASGEVAWATQCGAPTGGFASAIDVAEDGSILVAGKFEGADMPLGAGGPNETILPSSGGVAVFVARFDSEGGLLWARGTSGTADAFPGAIAATATGGAVITGYFDGGTLDFGGGAEPLSSLGTTSIVASYGPDGQFLWARIVADTTGFAEVNGVAPFADGSVLVGGAFGGETLLLGAGEPTETTLVNSGDADAFYAAFAADGALLWARQTTGEYVERVKDVATMPDGSFFVVGEFASVAMTFDAGEPSQIDLSPSQLSPAFAAHFDAEATVEWATSFGCGDYAYLYDADLLGADAVVAAGACQEAMTTTDEQLPPEVGAAFGFGASGSLEKNPFADNGEYMPAVAVAGAGDGSFVFGGATWQSGYVYGTDCALPLENDSGSQDVYLVRVAP
jgi:hypothetical protein